MPLVNNNKVQLKSSNDINVDDKVFKIRFTGEIFVNYSDYIERLEYYRQRIFTCKYTGKSNLTYEEALTSEHNYLKNLKPFPEPFLQPLIKFIHLKQMRLNDLINEYNNIIDQNLYIGERVQIKHNNKKYNGIIRDVVENGEVAMVELENDDLMKDQYGNNDMTSKTMPLTFPNVPQVLPMTPLPMLGNVNTVYSINPTMTFPNQFPLFNVYNAPMPSNENIPLPPQMVPNNRILSVMKNSPSLIRSERNSISKAMIKSKIKEISTKGNYSGAPYIVHEELLVKYGMDTTIPDDIKELMLKNKKRKRSDEPSDSLYFNNLKAKKSMYPMEDLEIERTEPDELLEVIMNPSSDFDVPQSCISDLLLSYLFLNRFSNALKLYPFSFEDFVGALKHNETCTLIEEIHIRLLKSLGAKESPKIKKLSRETWKDHVFHYLKNHSEEFGHDRLINIFGKKDYESLTIQQKLVVLSFLCDQSVDSNVIRKDISETLEKKIQLSKANWEDQMNIRRQFKMIHQKKQESQNQEGTEQSRTEQSQAEEETNTEVEEDLNIPQNRDEMIEVIKKKQEDYEREASSLTLRVAPLGMDRFYNRYWWFGKVLPSKSNGAMYSTLDACLFIEYYSGNVDFEANEELKGYDSLDDEDWDLDEEESSDYESESESSESSISDEDMPIEDIEEEKVIGTRKKKSVKLTEEYEEDEEGEEEEEEVESDDDYDEKNSYEEEEEEESTDETACVYCKSLKDPSKMLLCDECDRGYHMYCLQPPLTKVPKGDWFCDSCTELRNETPEQKKERLTMEKEKKKKEQEEKKKQELEAKKKAEEERIRKQKEREEKLKRREEKRKIREAKRKEREIERMKRREERRLEREEMRKKLKEEKREKLEKERLEEEERYKQGDILAHKPVKCYMGKKTNILWGYFSSPEEFEKILNNLDSRGNRESKLKNNLEKKKEMIISAMNKRVSQINSMDEENIISTRRSTRQTSQQRKLAEYPFLKYVNKYAKINK